MKKTQIDCSHGDRKLGLQKHLIQVVFADTMRFAGIPEHWLECEVRIKDLDDGVCISEICLVMHRRDGHVLRHSLSFQTEMLKRLARYENFSDLGTCEWLWKYSSQCSTAEAQLPSARDWAKTRIHIRKTMNSVRLGGTNLVEVQDSSRYLRNIFSHL